MLLMNNVFAIDCCAIGVHAHRAALRRAVIADQARLVQRQARIARHVHRAAATALTVLSVICVNVNALLALTLKCRAAWFASSVTLLPPLIVTFDPIALALLNVIVIGSGPQSKRISFAVARALLNAASVQLAVAPLPTVTRPSGKVRNV